MKLNEVIKHITYIESSLIPEIKGLKTYFKTNNIPYESCDITLDSLEFELKKLKTLKEQMLEKEDE